VSAARPLHEVAAPMSRNVEIKARIVSVEALVPRVARLADGDAVEIRQDDTFFTCAVARLKLREFADGHGELIYYERADRAGPKESFYLRSRTSDPGALRESLSRAYGVAGRVIKCRTLLLVGRTRVHLDRVQGLGDFIELEVVLGEDEPAAAGVREARALMAELGIDEAQLVTGAYVDLQADVRAAGSSHPAR
jgi:adenylate cyclase class IV